ncbi:MAG: metal ABC transporter permease [Chloroflexota bacterium]
MLSWLLDPLQFNFIIRAMIAAIMVGIICPVLGTYVVLRGMTFFSEALSHTILPGVAAAFLLGWPLTVGALFVGLFTAIGIGVLTERGGIKEDSATGIIYVGMFALGIAMLSASQSYTIDLAHFLFGNILGVSRSDLWVIAGLGGVVLLTIFFFYKELLIISFDPILAVTLRLPTTFFRYLLLILIAITVVAGLQVVGISLTIAMIVTPPATAALLTRRLPSMMGLAALIGIFSGIVGLYASFYLNIASGAAIVLTVTLIFIVVFSIVRGREIIG